MTLLPRLLHHGSFFSSSSSSSSNHTCLSPTINDPPQVPFISNLSFQQFSEIFSGACLGVVCLISFFLIFRHATNFTVPREQRQIIRIILLLPIFSLISLLCILFPSSAISILPLADLYESLSFAAFFLLLLTYLSSAAPHSQPCTPTQALKIFQFPFIMLLVLLITEITQAKGIYCEAETKPYFAKLWVTILKALTTVIAIATLLPIFKQNHKLLGTMQRKRSPIMQLLAFKGIILLNFLQTILFSFLTPHLSATNKLTTLDLTIVIPRLILSVEMVVFAGVFWWGYGVEEYVVGGKKEGGLRALGQAVNVLGFVGEMVKEVKGRGGEGEGVGGKYESVGLTGGSEEGV
ncbi:DUF300 domain-containing protein [Rutstroemia sp. NJR-2017a WRK4]|nr:DUF300 domain-containing protein [Rutstroemia sp. NJR-2017a WRK4]